MIKLEINKNTKVGMEFNKLQKFYWSEKTNKQKQL
jgi:hypothetical protein